MSIPAAFQTALDGYGPDLAVCVKITPVYGSVVGLCSLDAQIVYGGVTYEPELVSVTEIEQPIGTEIPVAKFVGLYGGLVSRADHFFGFWRGAAVEMFTLTFDDTSRGAFVWHEGYVGEITGLSEIAYECEVQGKFVKAVKSANRETSVRCLYPFEGTECGVVATTYTTTVSSVSADGLTVRVPATGASAGDMDNGKIEALAGTNLGVHPVRIKTHTIDAGEDVYVLAEAFPGALAGGTSVRVKEGCRHTPSDCQRHSNYNNYGGQPDLPGEDNKNQAGG